MDSLQTLIEEWAVIQTAPVLSILLVAVGGIFAWWLRSRLTQNRIQALRRQSEARDERRVLIEERLAAVMRNETMLKAQVAALQGNFQIVESQVLHEGRVPALIAATGSTASTITNIALTTEALAGSLSVLRLGVGGEANGNGNHPAAVVEKQEPVLAA